MPAAQRREERLPVSLPTGRDHHSAIRIHANRRSALCAQANKQRFASIVAHGDAREAIPSESGPRNRRIESQPFTDCLDARMSINPRDHLPFESEHHARDRHQENQRTGAKAECEVKPEEDLSDHGRKA